MKRGAEKQLSKDDRSDDEGQVSKLPCTLSVSDALSQEETLEVGFKKADESVLATRK